jgi:hypothetical protein
VFIMNKTQACKVMPNKVSTGNTFDGPTTPSLSDYE